MVSKKISIIPMAPDQIRAYNAILKKKDNFGTFHKTCFHLHTPASHDYQLLERWSKDDYRNASAQEILNVCITRHVLPLSATLEDIELNERRSIYKDKKEFLSFLMIANELITNSIEIVLVSDHNTVSGNKKLEIAIDEMYRMKKMCYTTIIYGIEISCADKNHVVGIFDPNKIGLVEQWLHDNLYSEEEGSFVTSMEVIAFFQKIKGLAYIAHINSSHIFDRGYLSFAYKEKLFKSSGLPILGVSEIDAIDRIEKRLREDYKLKKHFVLDNDSHYVDTIGENVFWIKCGKRKHQTIIEALNDYEVSISLSAPIHNTTCIRGIYIENDDSGFLCGKDGEEAYCLTFSDALNCIIGARGAGKSTVLEIMEFCLGQKCQSVEMLEFLCSHGNTWILFEIGNDQYLLEMRFPVKDDKTDNVLRCFGYNPRGYNDYRYHYNSNRIKEYTEANYITLYRLVFFKDDTPGLVKIKNIEEVLGALFNRKYSINSLVSVASGRQLNQFISDIVFENDKLIYHMPDFSFTSIIGLKRALEKIEKAIIERRANTQRIIGAFNQEQKELMQIIVERNSTTTLPPFGRWIFGQFWEYDNRTTHFAFSGERYNLTCRDLVDFYEELFMKYGALTFFKCACEDHPFENEDKLLCSYCTTKTQKTVDEGIMDLTPEKASQIIQQLCRKIVCKDTLGDILAFLRAYVEEIDHFSLEFNINSRAGSSKQQIFKNIRQLSLGQKVVAMLSFILSYSDHAHDFRPLLLDQPEDNLDNQYIYNNLVNTLRETKSKRQIIIATHNATIVTNAMADQVCVMESDNIHGWIDCSGYPSEERIKKRIINYLEGGEESFRHKIKVYSPVLFDEDI